jgi:hypothetical protein
LETFNSGTERFGQTLDPLLDVSERPQAALNHLVRNVLQYVGRNSAALCAAVDLVAQQAEAFDKLHVERAFQLEQHRGGGPKAFQLFRIPQAIVCLHPKYAHIIPAAVGNRFEDPLIVIS